MSSETDYPLDDFSLPTGGVILRTSDRIEIKTYKNILALASPFFRDMFTLPQADNEEEKPSQSAESASGNNAPVIDVSESSTTIKMLLRLIYPIVPPPFPGISEGGKVTDARELVSGIEPILTAALKYDMQSVVEKLTAKLLDAAETTLPDGTVIDDTLALRIFVLACRLKMKEVARRAAYASLKGNIVGVFIKDLRQINAAQYLRLLQFHTNMADGVDAALTILSSQSLKCSSCGDDSFSPAGKAKWWLDFVARARNVISRSPTSQRIFTIGFSEQSRQMAKNCRGPDCQKVPEKWPMICQEMKEEIDFVIADPEVDPRVEFPERIPTKAYISRMILTSAKYEHQIDNSCRRTHMSSCVNGLCLVFCLDNKENSEMGLSSLPKAKLAVAVLSVGDCITE